jgi:3'-phosphoadenosine 5'-phosphosulfate sulfotransferase (PAPS reductase)/FAD synthetase
MTDTNKLGAGGRGLIDRAVAHSDELFHVVSLSGGKDSTATLLLMIEKGMPIDLVLSADTGMEFPEMYTHLAKVDTFLYKERGIHITTLRHPKSFEWLMFDVPLSKASAIEKRQAAGLPLFGNGWPGMRVRWCTGQLKTHLISKEVNRLK